MPWKKKIVDRVHGMKPWQMMLYDMLAICVTYGIAIWVLTWSNSLNFDHHRALLLLPSIILIKILIYAALNLYKLMFRNAGFDEVFKLALIVTITNIGIAILTIIPALAFIPAIYLLFTNVFEIFLMVLPRIIQRFLRYLNPKKSYLKGKRTLLVGAGAGGKMVLDEIRNNPEMLNNPIAFVDDDDSKIGNIMNNYPILGPVSSIKTIIDNYNIEEVIICIANITDDRFQEIIHLAAERPVTIKRLPKFKNLSKDAPKKLLDVRVEDLLSRDVIKLDNEGISDFISGKRVLVTGAGGSIGSELVRQIIREKPEKLMLFDIYENNVYDLQMELNHLVKTNKLEKVDYELQIGSVYNYKRLETVFKSFKPNLVFHAAAYKHVPLMEGSSVEAVRTNVMGTNNVCELANKYNVEKMVLVSSDKAVRPTNVMGATKRFAEMIIQYHNQKSKTNYSAVRFGNVLGSNGSVVPLFRKQIENGGPLTVTHKDIIRYFMTIPEAVSLILQSGVYAKGGEIFILDMGDPVKIYDLAEKMIRLSGMKPNVDIKIEVTGLRPGEKLYEELLVNQENENIKTENDKIFIEKIDEIVNVDLELAKFLEDFEDLDNVQVKELVQKYVTSYTIKK